MLDASIIAYDIAIAFIIGIVSSISSVLLLYKLKPNLQISSKIARQIGSDGVPFYAIKVINHGKCAVKNVHADLEYLIPRNVPNGVVYETIGIELRKQVNYIKGKGKHNGNFYIFNTKEDLNATWFDPNNMQVIIRVYCEHTIFSTGKMFTYTYKHKASDIVLGTYEYGNTLSIIPDTNIGYAKIDKDTKSE